jgi:hypothetical protein
MSNAEHIAVSLEMSKRLKNSGWPQNGSFFYWHENSAAGHEWTLTTAARINYWSKVLEEKAIAAPTAEEILRDLPYIVILQNEACRPHAGPDGEGGFVVFYGSFTTAYLVTRDHSFANAAAAMWCLLRDSPPRSEEPSSQVESQGSVLQESLSAPTYVDPAEL